MGASFKAGRVSRTVIKPQPGFRAELPGLDLATLIQMTCARRERLVVRVSSYGEEGYLYSGEGRLVHATVGDLVGDEAVLRMLSWPTGDFSICDRAFPLRPTVETSTEGLLLLAAQRSDEAALDRETDDVLHEQRGLAEELEGDEPSSFRPYAPLPALSMPPRTHEEPQRVSKPPPAPPRTWPLEQVTSSPGRPSQPPVLASFLQARPARDDEDLPTMPMPAPSETRDAILPSAGSPRASSPPPAGELPPVSLGRISEPPRRRSEPPVSLPRPVAPARRLPPPPPAHARKDASLLASVRLDARGEVKSSSGGDEQLAQLVAYVRRIASLVQADFALDPFDALHAELSGKRVVIYREDDDLVGTVMTPGSSAQELRQRLGV